MQRKRATCEACAKVCRGRHCVDCAILWQTRKPKGNAGDPRSGAFKRTYDEFGARQHGSTVSVEAPSSWWTNASRERMTDTARGHLERMQRSPHGRPTNAITWGD
jgi:hypothetical protein